MNGWSLGQEVALPDGGRATVAGVVRLHGQTMVIVQTMPEEMMDYLTTARGFATMAMYPEDWLEVVDE